MLTAAFNENLTVVADPGALSVCVAVWLLNLATSKEGVFAICLSGGSTPKLLYQQLAAPPFQGQFPWSRTHLFWGDERFVAQDAPASNYRMVREALLARISIPKDNIHPIATQGLTHAAAAAAYERELKSFYGSSRVDPARPIFDVTLLGLGTDGHTASLFPSSPVLMERERWVSATFDPQAEARITMTYPTLESSQHVAFLITGKSKRAILNRLMNDNIDVPAARLSAVGETRIFADIEAMRPELRDDIDVNC